MVAAKDDTGESASSAVNATPARMVFVMIGLLLFVDPVCAGRRQS
jgi:hypothetical protein